MNIFVTEATGVLGRSCVDLLIRDGHRVGGLARSAANVATIQKLGGEPIEGDLFDPASVCRAIAGCEAVLHLATKIPPSNKMKQPCEQRYNLSGATDKSKVRTRDSKW